MYSKASPQGQLLSHAPRDAGKALLLLRGLRGTGGRIVVAGHSAIAETRPIAVVARVQRHVPQKELRDRGIFGRGPSTYDHTSSNLGLCEGVSVEVLIGRSSEDDLFLFNIFGRQCMHCELPTHCLVGEYPDFRESAERNLYK